MERTRHFIFDSGYNTNLTPDGNSFFVNMQPPIEIPQDAMNVSVRTTHVSLWNVVPNIITGLNDVLRVTVTLQSIGITTHTFNLVYPEGVYSLDTLNTTTQRLFRAALGTISIGAPYFYDLQNPWFTLDPDESTGKTIITPTREFVGGPSNVVVFDFTTGSSIRGLLGFDAKVETITSPSLSALLSQNIAKFNNIDVFLIVCPELAGAGIPLNGRNAGIIARVPITGYSAGDIMVYEPYDPFVIGGSHLAGNSITRVSFLLTNQDLFPIVMREGWSLSIAISFVL